MERNLQLKVFHVGEWSNFGYWTCPMRMNEIWVDEIVINEKCSWKLGKIPFCKVQRYYGWKCHQPIISSDGCSEYRACEFNTEMRNPWGRPAKRISRETISSRLNLRLLIGRLIAWNQTGVLLRSLLEHSFIVRPLVRAKRYPPGKKKTVKLGNAIWRRRNSIERHFGWGDRHRRGIYREDKKSGNARLSSIRKGSSHWTDTSQLCVVVPLRPGQNRSADKENR